MKRLALASASLAVLVPGVAEAAAPSARHQKDYTRAYRAVAKKFGARAPGRNIVAWGMAHRKATDDDVMASLAVLSRMLAPPPLVRTYTPRAYTPTTYTPTAAPSTSTYHSTYMPTSSSSYSSGSSGYSIPSSIVMCESGGNYGAVNPSGAGGAYQIMPSTWAAYGGSGLPQNASPAEQDRIAAKIYAGGAGRGQWSC